MLTDKIIKNLKPQEKRYQITDGTGLVLYVHPQGKKVFYADFRLRGTKICKKIGEYPSTSLSQARNAILALKNGKDLPENNITLQEAYENWIFLKEKSLAPKTLFDIKSQYNRLLAPKLKRIYVKNLDPIIVKNALADLNKDGEYLKICIALRILNQILTWCINSGYLEFNKCQNVAYLFPKYKIKNNPTLFYTELHTFFKSLVTYNRNTEQSLFILFIITTLLRFTETSLIKYSWISKDCINIPAEITKTRREFKVPITPLVQAIIDKRREILKDINTDLLWYSPTKKDNLLKTTYISRYLRFLGYKNIQTVHGFRAMGRTWMAENNIREDVAEYCLSHVSKNIIIRTYQRSDLFKERSKAMQKWNNYIIKEFKKGTGIDIYDWIASL